jgi:hypothetical protein
MATIRIDNSKVYKWLEDAPTKAQAAILMKAQQGANKMQNYAKQNKRWTNRTGHAVQRLVGYVEKFSGFTKIRINISHGVDYGKWLELAHEQKYAILNETVQKTSKEILGMFSNLMGDLK